MGISSKEEEGIQQISCKTLVKNKEEDVKPSSESNTTFKDIKGVDEGKAELQEVVHYLRDPKVLKGHVVDLTIIARGSLGFSGADIASLVNSAATRAAVESAEAVNISHLKYAKDKIIMEVERKSDVISEESRKVRAFHESGHAIVAIHIDGALPIHKATIIPRGQYLGMVAQLPDNDQKSFSLKQMLAKLDVLLGGRVAEEIILGEDGFTSAASDDLKEATSLAKAMTTKYGMSKGIGIIFLGSDNDIGRMSSRTRLLVEQEVKGLLEKAYCNAKLLLMKNIKKLHARPNVLLKHETLDGSQINGTISQFHFHPQQVQVNDSRGIAEEDMFHLEMLFQ